MFKQICAREGYLEMLQYLLTAVSIGVATEGPLKGQESILWADVDAKNRAQQTALMLTMLPRSHRRANRSLPEFEASMCLMPVEGEEGHVRMAALLQDNGASVTCADHRGQTVSPVGACHRVCCAAHV